MIKFENLEKKRQFIALLISLILNTIVFACEVIIGYLIKSVNIVADGVDSFGDSLSYSIAIYGFFSVNKKNKDDSGMLMGIVQIFSAAFILEEILRQIFLHNQADFSKSLIVALISMCINIICAFLLWKAKHIELNMKAALIFSFMDVFMNLYTILSCLIAIFIWPNEILDIIGGSLFFIIISYAAIKIFIERSKRVNELKNTIVVQ
ncbi:MAG: cation transporter [Mycoplasmataceae bacterium]|nr:cation transporter [Mycoplasmataceae bacterium]